jgi:hypothetical protein
MRSLLAALCLALLLLGTARAQEEDPLSLAALLISDGNWSRAAAVLDEIDPQARGLDRVRYHSLRGLLALQQDDNAQAAASFRAAIDADPEQTDPTLYLYLARAQLLSDAPADAIATLQAAGEAVDALPSSWLIRAQAARVMGDMALAWAALSQGADRFPERPEFSRQQVLLLVELGLTREAGDRASGMLAAGRVTAADALIFSEALRRSGALQQAAVLLEEARLRFPEDPDIPARQAAVALDAGQPLTAARFLQVAAEYDSAYALDAAELFRRAGHLEAALYMNAQVEDPIQKVRQRFGLLLDAQDYERALALQPRLSRLALTQEDSVAYGLAYALFRTGDPAGAEALLKTISDPDLFEKATALRQAMERCAEQPGECG